MSAVFFRSLPDVHVRRGWFRAATLVFNSARAMESGQRPSWLLRDPHSGRLRAPWRVAVYLVLVGVITQPLVSLLKRAGQPLLNAAAGNVVGALGFLGALALTARFLERRTLAQFGLQPGARGWAECGVGALLGAALMSFVCAVYLGLGWVRVDGLFPSAFAPTSFAVAAGAFVVRHVFGSFFEELFARGYLLRTIAESARGTGRSADASILIAAASTSVLFGAAHAFNPDASVVSCINLTLLGVVFALPMIRLGRLWLSIGAHAGWNVLQDVVCGFPNSGKPSQVSLLETRLAGPGIWTGGPFGPEGGLVVSLTLSLVVVASSAWLLSRPGGSRLHTGLAENDPGRAAVS